MINHRATLFEGLAQLPAEEILPLAGLFDIEKVTALIQERISSPAMKITDCGITHVRYHPRVSGTVCYELKFADGSRKESTPVFAKCVGPTRWQELKSRLENYPWDTGTLGFSHFIVPELRTVFFEFTNDMEIPGLRTLSETLKSNGGFRLLTADDANSDGEIAFELSDLQRLKYKPENRCVMRGRANFPNHNSVDNTDHAVVIRFERRKSVPSFGLMKQLHAGFLSHPTLGIPKPLFYHPEKRILVMSEVKGTRLSDLLVGPRGNELLASAVKNLAALHSCRNFVAPRIDSNSALAKAARMVEFLIAAKPEEAQAANEILVNLQSLERSSARSAIGLVHGDFHQGQVLHHQGRTWILDFEKSHTGETVADLGNLLAQLKCLRLKGKLDSSCDWEELSLSAYEEASCSTVPRERLRFWIVIGLLELAAKQFRGLRKNWPKKVNKILKECQSVLDA